MFSNTPSSLAGKLSAFALSLCILPFAADAAAADTPAEATVTVPSTTVLKNQGLKTAIVAATDTSGDIDVALRALKAAHIALQHSPGYDVLPADKVASTLQNSGIRWPFAPRQFEEVRKKLGGSKRNAKHAERALAVSVTPGDGTSATYSAVVELYDFATGGLVGRGESTFTAPIEPASANSENEEESDRGFAAVDGAIFRAIEQMNAPASIEGVVVSLPTPYQTRLSKGALHGLRPGARIEYIRDNQPVAYGTAIEVSSVWALATIAPENALSEVVLNGKFRLASNPPAGLAGETVHDLNDKKWKKYERESGLAAGLAALGYLLFIR